MKGVQFTVILLVIVAVAATTFSLLYPSINFSPPVSSCAGQADGTACALSSQSAKTVIVGNIALAGGSLGICKNGNCVTPPSNFTCPSGTFECAKSAGKICCPGTNGGLYKCSSVDSEPYCQPNNKTSCESIGTGWTLCSSWRYSTDTCCPPGTKCTSAYGHAICTTKTKNGCPTGTSACDEFCCTSSQTCTTIQAPAPINSFQVCSANSCGTGQVLCPSQEPTPPPGTNPHYPSICCSSGTCAHGTSGRPFCTDGNPGL